MIGKTILHYNILKKLGEGGMGVVYLADDTRLKRNVAIKFLPQFIALDNEARERFKIEAQAAAALNHPNITQIYAIEEVDDELFIVMEYVEGKELRDLIITPLTPPSRGDLDKSPFEGLSGGQTEGARRVGDVISIDSALSIATQIAEGLQAAHKKGIIHRDIKSSNIMITEEVQVKIMDFGLAKVGQGAQLTKEQSTLGTAAYMSPEQVRSDNVDQRTDIWSFGVVLYEMLTGKLPFRGDYEQAVIYSILNEEPDWDKIISGQLSEESGDLLQKLLTKNPDERFRNMNEIIQKLKSVQNESSIDTTSPKNITGVSRKEKSLPGLAVLPFSDLKNDPQMGFLGFALADQIISALSYVKNILVRPSSAVRKYQNHSIDAPTAGKDLQVDFILTGYYLKEADIIRLNVELVNTQSNDMVWRESIEVKYENTFKLQDIVSEKVTHGLEIQFSQAERSRIQTNIPENPLAYEYYLRSVSYQHTNEGDKLAIEMLLKAIGLDKNYAPAYAELGYRLRSFGTYALQGAEAYQEPEQLYLKALSLNSELLSALGGLANLYTDIGKTEKALEYAKQMLSINPNHALAHYSLSYLFRYAGMLEESAREADEALTLDSHYPHFRSAGYTFFYMGDYQRVLEIFGQDKGSVMDNFLARICPLFNGKADGSLKTF